MADNLSVTAGSGSTIGMDEVVDGTLGTVKVGFGKIMDGTLDGTDKLKITTENAAQVAGDKAHDAADAGNPIKIGGKARSSAPTDVTANDRVDAYFDLKGRLKTDGSDVTQPVSGTVTANLAAGTNNIGDIDVLTVPAPLSTTGGGTEATAQRVTIANDSTGVLSVDDNGGSLTVEATSLPLPTGAATLAEQQTQTTALQLIDDTVATDGSATPTKGLLMAGQDGTNAQTIKTDSNGELQVDVLTMPTTTIQDGGGSITVDGSVTVSATNLDVRDIDAATDDITIHGDVGVVDQLDLTNSNPLATAIVDANGDQITSFGGGTQYTEDAAAAANPTGTVPILVRKDTPAGEVTTDGDNVAQRGTNYGAAYVTLLDTGGSPVSVGGGTQYDEDTAHVSGDKVTMAGVVQQSADSALSTDGDRSLLQVDSSGYLKVNVKAGAAGGTQYTEGDTDASITGTAMMMEGAGNALVAAPGTTADGLLVNLGPNNDVTVTGTVAVTQSGTWDEVGINDSGNSITVDDGGSSLTVDGTITETNSGSILTSVQLIDDTVTTLGTDTYTEATSKGLTIGAVRRDADTTLVNTTNEFGPLQMDANGRLKVEVFDGGDSHTVDGTVAATQSGTWILGANSGVDIGDVTINNASGASAVNIQDGGNSITVDGTVAVTGVSTLTEQQTQTTALQLIDDIVYTDDTSTHSTGTSKGALIMGAATPTDTAVNANDIGAIGMTNNRAMYVSVQDALPTGTNNIGDVDIASIAAGDNNIGNVDIVTMPNVTLAAGTNTNEVVGDVAEDQPLAGNPLRTGVRASAAEPTAMSGDGDIVTPWADRRGRTVVTKQVATGAQTSVAGSASSTTLLASNTSRKGFSIYNDSTAILYVRFQATASTSNFSVKLQPDAYYEDSMGYTGVIDGIWASATGNARITEYS